jgi:hypothetical protein
MLNDDLLYASRQRLLLGLFLPSLIAAGLIVSFPSAAATKSPSWNPKVSEKLIKLPSSYLKKSVDHDFAESELGLAIQSTSEKADLKIDTLKDLQDSIERAEGELATELRHQFLAEKRDFVMLLSDKNKMRRKHLKTKQRLFERMLRKMGDDKAAMTPVRQKLIDSQDAAATRFKSSIDKVDMHIFQSTSAPTSKYAKKYSQNMAVIEKLVARIQTHKMSTAVKVDGKALTKHEYLRQLVAGVQAEVSILEQEETILGYMAKLVALDALDLSEQALDADLADSEEPAEPSLARAADYFVTN